MDWAWIGGWVDGWVQCWIRVWVWVEECKCEWEFDAGEEGWTERDAVGVITCRMLYMKMMMNSILNHSFAMYNKK